MNNEEQIEDLYQRTAELNHLGGNIARIAKDDSAFKDKQINELYDRLSEEIDDRLSGVKSQMNVNNNVNERIDHQEELKDELKLALSDHRAFTHTVINELIKRIDILEEKLQEKGDK